MWSNSFKAGNTIYRLQDKYSSFTLCDHIWLFVGKVHVAARDSVQSHLLQKWLFTHGKVIMAGSYGINTLHGITKLSAVQYSEEFYLILFPNTSIQDNLLHLTLLNQCFRQQSTSEMSGVHERVGAAGVNHKSYVPILHSFYTHIHKNLTFKRWISCCSTLPGIYSSPGLPLCAFRDSTHNPIQITIRLCQ